MYDIVPANKCREGTCLIATAKLLVSGDEVNLICNPALAPRLKRILEAADKIESTLNSVRAWLDMAPEMPSMEELEVIVAETMAQLQVV